MRVVNARERWPFGLAVWRRTTPRMGMYHSAARAVPGLDSAATGRVYG